METFTLKIELERGKLGLTVCLGTKRGWVALFGAKNMHLIHIGSHISRNYQSDDKAYTLNKTQFPFWPQTQYSSSAYWVARCLIVRKGGCRWVKPQLSGHVLECALTMNSHLFWAMLGRCCGWDRPLRLSRQRPPTNI